MTKSEKSINLILNYKILKKINKAITRNLGTDLISNLFLGNNNNKKGRKTIRKIFGLFRQEQKKGKAKCKS